MYNLPVVEATVDYLNDILPHSNWFIAGGALVGKYFTDIDVFFYSEKDFKTAYDAFLNVFSFESYSSSKAVTFCIDIDSCDNEQLKILKEDKYEFHKLQIQLVKYYFGTTKEIIEKFDLNKSQIAITPNKEIIKSDIQDKPLHIVYNNTNTSTFNRFKKYINSKKIEGDYHQALYDYTHHVIECPYHKVTPSYEDDEETTALEYLLDTINFYQRKQYNYRNFDKKHRLVKVFENIEDQLKPYFPELFI